MHLTAHPPARRAERDRPLRRMLSAAATATMAGAVLAAFAPAAHASQPEWHDATYGSAFVGGAMPSSLTIGSPGAVDGAGRAIVSRFDAGSQGLPPYRVTRLTADGQGEPTFGLDGSAYLPGPVLAVHADSANRILVAEYGQGGGGVVRLTRLTAGGSTDPTFGTSGVMSVFNAPEQPSHVKVIERSSGLMLLATVDGVSYLAAVTHSGVLDTTWAPGAAVPGVLPVTGGVVRDIAADGDAIVAAGTVNATNPPFGGLVRYGATGVLDASFGFRSAPDLWTSGVSVSGSAYLAGGQTIRAGGQALAVARFSSSGPLDASFGVGGVAEGPSRSCIRFAQSTVLAGSFIYVSGTGCTPGGQLIRLSLVNGALDTGFGDGGELVVDEVDGTVLGNAVALGAQASGQVLVAIDVPGGDSGVMRLRTSVTPGAFVPLPPSRILDTRVGNGAPAAKVGGQSDLVLQVAGRGGVPASGAAAVVLNVTVTEPDGAGYITAYPFGTTAPLASNLNFTPGLTIPNLVTVKLGTGGQVALRNGAVAPVHLIADVAGYYVPGTATEAGTFVALEPARLLDTRPSQGGAGAVGAMDEIELQVTGEGGVPVTDVAAVVLNVTVTEPGGAGYITAFPTGTDAPLASNLNFTPGQTIPNLVTVKLGDGGRVSLINGSAAPAHLIADVAGYYRAGTAMQWGTFVPLDPVRLLDTRPSQGGAGAVSGLGSIELAIDGNGGVPAQGSAAVVLNVTVTGPAAPGYITVYPATIDPPLASNLNFSPGQTIPNLVLVKTGGGEVGLYNGSPGSAHLIADIAGYFRF